ncbi:MAG: NAD(P)/FAD-dependent oxidoreductase [Bdellovibrionales bacterium]|nr:NAD(P)/FAD-dependent oxidoreductase [Bdellovibrionales bacterium]
MNIVIIGAGFGGLEACKELSQNKNFEIYLVDKNNYHLFQPLLYQVASAAVSAADICSPVRSEFKKYKNVHFIFDQFESVLLEQQKVQLKNMQITYDVLILACGSKTTYYNHKEWSKYSFPLKTLKDARNIRNKVLLNLEIAKQCSINELNAYLTFIIVGGGPTGVEMAGSLCQLGLMNQPKTFHHRDKANVVLLEKGNRLLPTFPHNLSEKAFRKLHDMGVDIYLNQEVSDINENGVKLMNGQFFESHCVVWATGVVPTTINWLLPFRKSPDGRIIVNDYLQVQGQENIYCIGDQAYCKDKNGNLLPGLASVAKQQGKYLGKKLKGKAIGAFAYKNWGQMATLGTNSAVVDFGSITFNGYFGWLVWSIIHIYYLVSFRNKLMVFVQWIWSYLTFSPGAQVIDEEIEPHLLYHKPKKKRTHGNFIRPH